MSDGPIHSTTLAPGRSFGLIGVAGYIAPRHLRAIKETGGELKVAIDPADSVGVLDSYFPEARFFIEFERFDRHVDKLRRQGAKLDYICICSPNYLHDAHVRFALRSEIDAICEKPLVLNPWNIEGLAEIEASTGRRVNTIMQLRLHPAIEALRDRIANGGGANIHEVDLTYVASRGRWYHVSWKGQEQKSGGITTNIGVHFFDMLGFVFGELRRSIVHHRTKDRAAGFLEYQKARVRWFLSLRDEDLPEDTSEGQITYRSVIVDGKRVDFSAGFSDLHTASYREILKGNGFSVEDARSSIETVASIRSAPIEPWRDDMHPLMARLHKANGAPDG